MKCAIFTFVIGEQYQQMYDAIFRHSVETYCKKYDIDLKLITEPIEPCKEKQNLCCQKLLVVNQEWAQEYDAIAWLESDILISPNAPNIFDEVKDDKILYARQMSYNDPRYQTTWRDTLKIDTGSGENFFKSIGIDYTVKLESLVNEGMTIFQPKHHGKYLEKMYRDHEFGGNQPTQKGRDGTFLATREIWWWYQTFLDGKAKFIDSRWNAEWCYYRRIHAEPYENDNDLIVHARNYITHSYFCHIPDRENIDVIHFVYKMYFKNPNVTLIVHCGPVQTLSWLFHPMIRMKKFKNIYIVCTDDSAKHFVYTHFPRIQNMNFLPDNLYTFVKEAPDVKESCIQCESDWPLREQLESFLKRIHDA